jgi:hypothetical protein
LKKKGKGFESIDPDWEFLFRKGRQHFPNDADDVGPSCWKCG